MPNEPEIIMPVAPQRRMSIKGLVPSLPERGKIKIGKLGEKRKTTDGKGEWQRPVRLDHFRVTTMERGQDNNFVQDEEIHSQLGSDKPTEIPVRLLYDDEELNCLTRYAAYNGRTLWCSGDGETASRLMANGERNQIRCPCHLSDASYSPKKGDPPKCKINGSLSVIIDGASGLGGVWRLRTTGWNSVMALLGSMKFFRSITGGPLGNIPLMLRIKSKQGTNPVDGSPVPIHYVTLEYEGSMDDLRNKGYQIALDRETTHVAIKEIETQARQRLALMSPHNAPLPGDETEDVAQEFYPEQYDDPDGDSWTGNARPTRAQVRAKDESDGQPLTSTAHPIGAEDPPGEKLAKDTESKEIDEALIEQVDVEIEGYEIADHNGEVKLYAAAETGFLGVMNEAMRISLGAKPGSPNAQAFENVIANNDALLTYFAGEEPEVARRLTTIIEGARQQIAKARAPRLVRPTPAAVQAATSAAPVSALGTGVPTNQQQQDPPPPAAVRPPALSKDSPSLGSPKLEGASPSQERPIECQKLAYGPGRGIDWRRTTAGAMTLVSTLNEAEYKRFRQVNAQFLAEMNLAYKDGIGKLNAALAEKDAEFHG